MVISRPNSGRTRSSPQSLRQAQAVARLLVTTGLHDELPEGTRIYVLAPVVRGRKGEYGKMFKDLAEQGFARVASAMIVSIGLTPIGVGNSDRVW